MKNNSGKEYLSGTVIKTGNLTGEIFWINVSWAGTQPRAGQFFLVKPKTSSVFLARPLSTAAYNDGVVQFFVTVRGKGTEEIALLKKHDEILLTGPLGNCWKDFLPVSAKKIALVSGGVGIAPMACFSEELDGSNIKFDFFAGFKKLNKDELISIVGRMIYSGNVSVITENGGSDKRGFVTDFIKPKDYDAVYACGPQPMLKALCDMCAADGVPCFISMEKRMACGVGACLGCTVTTKHGNKRCCADGSIFNAEDICFE
ncbi:dihydroorotate dehydrogenase B (NAD(+)), electron transfer subunit [Spirochaetia bacterium]|nr:dihydroorotate dehydrogenase B (NAD(+)), electron transfer subunit [Spirochaetia bacterium]